MKCICLLQDQGDVVSESSGFNLNYKAIIVNGSERLAEFDSSALVPFSPSAVAMATAIKSAVIKSAPGMGVQGLTANDITIVGGLM